MSQAVIYIQEGADHAVTNRDLALLGDIDLGELDDSRRQLITHLHLVLVALGGTLYVAVSPLEVADHLLDAGIQSLVAGEGAARIDVQRVDVLEFLLLDDDLLRPSYLLLCTGLRSSRMQPLLKHQVFQKDLPTFCYPC